MKKTAAIALAALAALCALGVGAAAWQAGALGPAAEQVASEPAEAPGIPEEPRQDEKPLAAGAEPRPI